MDATEQLSVPPQRSCPREDCRVEDLGGSSTLMGWTPTYDKNGHELSRDPNISTHHMRCATCGEEWTCRTQYNVSTYTITKPRPTAPSHKPGAGKEG